MIDNNYLCLFSKEKKIVKIYSINLVLFEKKKKKEYNQEKKISDTIETTRTIDARFAARIDDGPTWRASERHTIWRARMFLNLPERPIYRHSLSSLPERANVNCATENGEDARWNDPRSNTVRRKVALLHRVLKFLFKVKFPLS